MMREGLVDRGRVLGHDPLSRDRAQARRRRCHDDGAVLAFKLPGRVATRRSSGAGNWVDGMVGAAGSTGRGEATLYNLSSHLIVELMRSGKSPKDAALEALRRIRENTIRHHGSGTAPASPRST
jgi:N4-(beta-N-acetylglucosaminyl)-L-asparaginase